MALNYRSNLARDPDTKRWHVRKKVLGRVFHRSFSSKRAANKYLEFLELKAAGVPLEADAPTLQAACESYVESRKRLNRADLTIAYYERIHATLQHLLGGLRTLDTISQENVDWYREKRGNEIGAGTINKEIAELSRVFRHKDVTPTWKADRLTHQPRERWVRPPADVARLWVEIMPETRAAVGLCLLAGLRAEEAYHAEASWCHWDTKELWIRVMKTSTTNRTALVDTLASALPRSGNLVQTTRNKVSHDLRRVSKKLAFDPPYSGPGAFRHHCGTWAHEHGGYTQEDIGLLLSHQRPGVTSRYLHSQAVSKKREMLEVVEKALLTALENLDRKTADK